MHNIQSAREKTISKLRKLGMDMKSRLVRDAVDDELMSISERLVKIRDNKQARFVVTLIQLSN